MVSLFMVEKTASRSTPKTKHKGRDGKNGLKRQVYSQSMIKSRSRSFRIDFFTALRICPTLTCAAQWRHTSTVSFEIVAKVQDWPSSLVSIRNFPNRQNFDIDFFFLKISQNGGITVTVTECQEFWKDAFFH